MGRLCRHRVRVVVRSSVIPGLIYEKCQANSTRHLLHETIRRSRVIPIKKKNARRTSGRLLVYTRAANKMQCLARAVAVARDARAYRGQILCCHRRIEVAHDLASNRSIQKRDLAARAPDVFAIRVHEHAHVAVP